MSRGSKLKYSNRIVFLSLMIAFVLANNVDPDEMLHYVAFHLDLHCCQNTHLEDTSIERVLMNPKTYPIKRHL